MSFSELVDDNEKYWKGIYEYRKNYIDIIYEKYVKNSDPGFIIDISTFKVVRGQKRSRACTAPEFGTLTEYYCRPAQKLIKKLKEGHVSPKKSKYENEKMEVSFSTFCHEKRGNERTCSVLKSNKPKRRVPLNTIIGSRRLLRSESITSDKAQIHHSLKDIPISCLSVSQIKSNVSSVQNKPLEKSINVPNSHLHESKKLEKNSIVNCIPKSEKDNVSMNFSAAYNGFNMNNIYGIKVHCRVPLYNLDIKQFDVRNNQTVKLDFDGKPLLRSINKAAKSSLPLTYSKKSLNELDISENNSTIPSGNNRPQDKLFSGADLSNSHLHMSKKLEENSIVNGIPKSEKDNVSMNFSTACGDFNMNDMYGIKVHCRVPLSNFDTKQLNVINNQTVKLGFDGKAFLKSINKASKFSLPLTYSKKSLNELDISENNSALPFRNIRPVVKLSPGAGLCKPGSNKVPLMKLISIHHKRIKKDASPAENSDKAVANFLRRYTNTSLDKYMKSGSKSKNKKLVESKVTDETICHMDTF